MLIGSWDEQRQGIAGVMKENVPTEIEAAATEVGSVEAAADMDEGSGRTVVVGVRLDKQSKELLTWTLVNAAEAGDQVVALHVVAKSRLFNDLDASSISRDFGSMLGAYEGFCNLKQIRLVLKVCQGSSIRKVLVREVNGFGADKVVTGVTKSNSVIGSFSISIAKYCAKKLPGECCVVAIDNGKVVFRREPILHGSHQIKGKKNNPEILNGSDDGSIAVAASNLLPLTVDPPNLTNSDGSPVSSPAQASILSQRSQSSSPVRASILSQRSQSSSPVRASILGQTSQSSSPVRASILGQTSQSSSPVRASILGQTSQSSSPARASVLVPKENGQTSQSSSPSSSSETKWPLIRRIVKSHRRTSSTSEKLKMSLYHLILRLPNWNSSCSSSIVHPTKKMPKPCPEEKLLEITQKELLCQFEKFSATCTQFTYEELAHATSFFASENLIGEGGNSYVYKGCHHLTSSNGDGAREIAVKKLKNSEDVLKEFVLEIDIITTLNHINVISLIGFCCHTKNLLLVYELVSRGSLEQNLHDVKEDGAHLSWSNRYKTAVGVADALNYLHSGASGRPIIHRDVKSSNILLSDDFNPKLSDFGFATWVSSSSLTSTQIPRSDVAGTFGYMAPEYFSVGNVNEMFDVYAFGVVLLELLSGRKPIEDDCPKNHQSLVMWAKSLLQSGESILLDSNLSSEEIDNNQLETMTLAASLCTQISPKDRPNMPSIVKLLSGDEETVKWARLKFSTSEEFKRLDGEVCPSASDFQSHLSLALLDTDQEDAILCQ